MRLPRPIQKAFDLLLAEMRHISGVLQKISETIDEKSAFEKKSSQPQPILRAELQIPENVQRQKHTSDNRQFRVQVWLAIATTLAFIAAAIYAEVAAFQWQTMNRTYTEIRKQTKSVQDAATAAQDSADVANKALRYAKESDRPWVGNAEGDAAEEKFEFVNGSKGTFFNIRNVGNDRLAYFASELMVSRA
jgi:hypothetical protein